MTFTGRLVILTAAVLPLLTGCTGNSKQSTSDLLVGEDTLTDTTELQDSTPDTDRPEVVVFDVAGDATDVSTDASDATTDGGVPNYCGDDPGAIFCPCDQNDDCNSGYCIPSSRGDQVCTRVCEEDCPDELECRLVRFPNADPTFLCVDLQVNLCRPCRANTDCQGNFGSVANRCVRFGALNGAFCGLGCALDDDCPGGYICGETEEVTGGGISRQCVPSDGATCECSPRAIAEAASTACSRLACVGSRACTPDGLSTCNASVPETEVCDGLDNNCNGATDEGSDDTDGDGLADCVDPDIDADGVLNADDNCPYHQNPGQEDSDEDGVGDACDRPANPTLVGTLPGSPANDNAPLVLGSAGPGSVIRIYTAANCAGLPAAQGTASADGSFALSVAVADDSTTTFYVTATNPDNGFATACNDAAPRVYIEDSTAPLRPELTTTNPRSPGNATTFAVLGIAEAGTTVTLYRDAGCLDALPATAVPGVNGAFSAQLIVAANGSLTVHAAAVDAAGNSSGCSAPITYRHDDIVPAPPTFSGTFPTSPSSTVTTVTLIGAAEPGASVAIYGTVPCSGNIISTQTTGPNGIFTAVITVAANTVTTFTATATDAAGNTSLCSPEGITYIHDDQDPAPPILLTTAPTSPGNSLLPVVSGTAEPFATVQLYSGANCTGVSFGTAQAASDGTWGVTATVNANAETFFYGRATDLAGRRSVCTVNPLSYRHDGVAPVAPTLTGSTPASPSHVIRPSLSGSGEAGATVIIYLNAACTAAADAEAAINSAGELTVTVLASSNTTTTWWATAVDPAGNASPCSSTAVTYRHDDTAPGAPILTLTRPESPSSNETPVVEGTAEALSTVDIFLNANCSGLPAGTTTTDATGAFEGTVAVALNAVSAIHAAATDAAGNVSACSVVPLYFNPADTEPLGPSFTGTTPESPNNAVTTPTLLGNAETGTTVRIHSDPDCLTAPIASGATAANGNFAIVVSLPANTSRVFYASAINAVGNVSPCSAPGIRYTHDSVAPTRPIWVSVTPTSPSNQTTTPTLRGRVEPSATVRIFSNSTCTTEVTSAAVTVTNNNLVVGVTAASNATTSWYANATDAAGNTSECSVAIAYTHDNVAPNAPTLTGTTPTPPSNSVTPRVSGNAEGSTVIRFYGRSDCTGSLLGQGNGSAAGAIDITITVGADQVTAIHATSTDAAGNTSGCSAAISYSNDSTPPDAPVWIAANPTSPNNTNTTPTLSGTAEPQATVRLFVGNSCTGVIAQTTTANAAGAFSFGVTVGQNTTTAFYAAAIDAVGNQSDCTSPSLPYTHDALAPGKPNITSSLPPSPNPEATPDIRGNAEANATLRLYTTSNCSGAVLGSATVDASGNWTVVDAPVTNNSTTVIYAAASDAVGNTSACSGGFSYRHDDITPLRPVVTGTSPTPVGNTQTPSVTGTVAEMGLRVRIYKTSDCTGIVLREGGNVPLNWTVTLVPADRNTTTTYYARAVDAAGNISECSTTSATYRHDDAAPNQPTDLTTEPPRWSKSVRTPDVLGSAEAAGAVTIFLNDNCGGAAHATTTAIANGTFRVGINVGVADIETSITVRVTDPAGNASGCSAAILYRYDTTAPVFTGAGAAAPAAADVGETTATVTWTAATDNFTTAPKMIYRVCRSLLCGATDCDWSNVTAPNITTTAAGVTSRTDTDLVADTRYHYAVRAIDEVGNEDTNTASASVKTRGRRGVSDLWIGENSGIAGLSQGGTHRWGAALPDPAANSNSPISFSLGSSHSCLIRADGAIRCTGANAYGQIGNGNTTNQATWAVVSSPGAAALQVAIGLEHTCAVLVTGQVRCWGNDSRGQLGNGTANSDSQSTAVTVMIDATGSTPLADVTRIALGDFHACALRANGETWCWGSNGSGQLAPEVTTSQSDYARKSKASGLVALTAGLEHTCGIDGAGQVFCWGYNVQGQLGDGTNDNSAVPRDTGIRNAVALGGSRRHVCAATVDGSAYCWGINSAGEVGGGVTSSGENRPVRVVGLTEVARIAGGDKYTCAQTHSGEARCWGLGSNGRLGTGNNDDSLSPALVAVPSSVSSVTDVQSGFEHSCARVSDGTAACWGNNTTGQLGNGLTVAGGAELVVLGGGRPVRRVAPGGGHSCAIANGGAVSCWGDNASGQLGLGNTVARTTPTVVSNTTAVDISLGLKSTCIVDGTRNVLCWGDNTGNRLGFTSGATTAPRAVTGIGNARQVAVGREHQCFARLDGRVLCWGKNDVGQVDGTPAAAITASPKLVPGVAGAIAVAAGDRHSCALIAGGTVMCWGSNASTQLGISNTALTAPVAVQSMTDAVEIAAGSAQSCARRVASGVLTCWGSNADGALGRSNLTVGSPYSSPQAVTLPTGIRFTQHTAGTDSGCATGNTGLAYCWGSNDKLEVGDGTTTNQKVPTLVRCLP